MSQPNIILTDHFCLDILEASTPNLAKLAAEGVKFKNAYSILLCNR